MKRPLSKIGRWLRMACLGFALLLPGSCKTKNELRREQEFERMKQEVKEVRGDRADVEVLAEELKVEVSRMSNVLEDRAHQQKQAVEELRKEMSLLSQRVQVLEQRPALDESMGKQSAERPKASFEVGKKFYDEGKYEEAVEILRALNRSRRGEDARKSQYWLAESYYANKEYASAALEFMEFKRAHPRDPLVPNATYRQANSFRSMGKLKEARLFYQELIEKYPKSQFTAKAKLEIKKLK